MKTNYAVLNDKLLPVDVAELLLKEGIGSVFTSVGIILNPSLDPYFINLTNLFNKATEANMVHTFTSMIITSMLSKLLSNNKNKKEKIMVNIIQGEETFLYIYFME